MSGLYAPLPSLPFKWCLIDREEQPLSTREQMDIEHRRRSACEKSSTCIISDEDISKVFAMVLHESQFDYEVYQAASQPASRAAPAFYCCVYPEISRDDITMRDTIIRVQSIAKVANSCRFDAFVVNNRTEYYENAKDNASTMVFICIEINTAIGRQYLGLFSFTLTNACFYWQCTNRAIDTKTYLCGCTKRRYCLDHRDCYDKLRRLLLH